MKIAHIIYLFSAKLSKNANNQLQNMLIYDAKIDYLCNMATKIVHKKLGRQKAEGLAFIEHNEIHIDERMKKKPYMLVVLHELLHIHFPDLSEKEVNRISKKICNSMWSLKFRRIDD